MVIVGVFVAVGALAVCVAKMFAAIFVSVAWVSGVGVALEAQDAEPKQMANTMNKKRKCLIIRSLISTITVL